MRSCYRGAGGFATLWPGGLLSGVDVADEGRGQTRQGARIAVPQRREEGERGVTNSAEVRVTPGSSKTVRTTVRLRSFSM